MKRIILFVIAFMLFKSVATAEDFMTQFEYSEGVSKKAIITVYNKDNKLIEAYPCEVEIEDKIFKTRLKREISDEESVRFYFPETKTILSGVKFLEEEKEEISNILLPYPSEYDAATAFMVVKSADTVVLDDEVKVSLKLLYQGREKELVVEEDKIIDSVPVNESSLYGMPVSSLMEGDVIYCTTYMSGKLRSIELIYRPTGTDIITDTANYGNNFENLYSDGASVTNINPIPISVFRTKNNMEMQYAFGLIKYREDGFITLTNKAGTRNDEIDIRMSPDTVVYVYDAKKRRERVSIGSIYDIEKSDIYNMDKLGNVLSWDSDEIHNYALARMSKANALDIIVYKNY